MYGVVFGLTNSSLFGINKNFEFAKIQRKNDYFCH